MDNRQLKQVPITKTGMLIRKPVADVFEALSTRTSPRNSGSPRAAEGSRLASRFNGIGKCTASRSR